MLLFPAAFHVRIGRSWVKQAKVFGTELHPKGSASGVAVAARDANIWGWFRASFLLCTCKEYIMTKGPLSWMRGRVRLYHCYGKKKRKKTCFCSACHQSLQQLDWGVRLCERWHLLSTLRKACKLYLNIWLPIFPQSNHDFVTPGTLLHFKGKPLQYVDQKTWPWDMALTKYTARLTAIVWMESQSQLTFSSCCSSP